MPLKPRSPEGSETRPLAKPFLHALNRMQDRNVARPEDLTDQARTLFSDTFGVRENARGISFSNGVVGLMSEHTHYFDGFAMLMPIGQGCAVTAQQTDEDLSQCVFGGEPARPLTPDDRDPRVVLLSEIAGRLEVPQTRLLLAVCSNVPLWWQEVSLTALGVAAVRALQDLFALPEDAPHLMELVRHSVEVAMGMPFSIAYPIAADDARPGSFVLVDTKEKEHLILPGAEPDVLGWGAIHADVNLSDLRLHVAKRAAEASAALEVLQEGGFSSLTSYRDLEHRDLERALTVVPPSMAPVVRYLVTENRRVQKLVAAVRRRDWQMMGALMVMSHAVQRDDWEITSPEADLVVDQVEGMSLEGLYGARLTGRCGTVLLVGQPFVVPSFLDRVQSEVRERFGAEAGALLL